MHDAALVVQLLAGPAHASLARAQASEVLSRFGDNIRLQSYDNSAQCVRLSAFCPEYEQQLRKFWAAASYLPMGSPPISMSRKTLGLSSAAIVASLVSA